MYICAWLEAIDVLVADGMEQTKCDSANSAELGRECKEFKTRQGIYRQRPTAARGLAVWC